MSNSAIEALLNEKHNDTLRGLGYRNGESKITLKERDLNPSLPENRIVTTSKRLSMSRKFTKELADAMTSKAFELGIISEALEFPIARYDKPEFIEWRHVNQEFSNPYLGENHGVFLVALKDEKAIYTQSEIVNSEIAEAINLNEDKSLLSHLQAGYSAYVYVNNFEVKWLSVPAYHASKKYFWSVHEYREQVKKWEKLKSDIKKAITFQAALDQHYRFKGLPFAWSAGVKQVVRDLRHKGLANGESHRTVVHLVLEDDYEEGRFARVKGDYLCTPKIGKPNWTSSDYEYEITVNGACVKIISHEITCKTCLTKIDNFLAARK